MIYTLDQDGIYRPGASVAHRNEEYDQDAFKMLLEMQKQHFWYRGRHRFLLSALETFLPKACNSLSAVDLGGGVGGWLIYLANHRPGLFTNLALADSSETALCMASTTLPAGIERFQVDLMNLGWDKKWDCAFLLDVIEHLPHDSRAIQQAAKSLKSGGILFVTTPAIQKFWSYNDELAHHLRRYTRESFSNLAKVTDLELCDARYFMFFLSPLYWLSRYGKKIKNLSEEEKRELLRQSHKIPISPINTILASLFCLETPLGHYLRFPWGTSILGVFRKR